VQRYETARGLVADDKSDSFNGNPEGFDWIATVHVYPSQMAQNFYTAIYAWTVCFLVTIAISLLTKPRREEELKGLVYALTEKAHETGGRWFMRPVPVGICVLILTLILNLIFR